MENIQIPRENSPLNLEDIRAADTKGMTLEELIVDIVLKSHYIVLETLSRVIRPNIFVNVMHPRGTRVTRDFMAKVTHTAEELRALPNAQIGKLDPKDARHFGLHEDVYYSTEWVKGQLNEHDTLTIAGVIGLSLYDEIQEFSASQYRRSGMIESVRSYQGVHEWLCARNHQKIIVIDKFFSFLGCFMEMKAPYAFQLAESLEQDQTIPESERKEIVTRICEGLVERFRYSAAAQKLKEIKEVHHRDMTPEEALLREIFPDFQLDADAVKGREEVNPALRDMTSEQLHEASVAELALSVRAGNCLSNAGIETIGVLLGKSADDLRGYRNFGQKSIEEIRAQLAKVNLHLRGEG